MSEILKSKDYKRIALDALRGNWKTAILTGFIASFFGSGITSGNNASFKFEYQEYISPEELNAFISTDLGSLLFTLLGAFAIVGSVLSIISLIFGGAVKMGYAKYNLNLITHSQSSIHDLLGYMNYKWKGFCMNFFVGLYTSLWSLLLVIPGIVKSYAYAMTPYILAENPEMSANDAISESDFIMNGHKWKLFCLHFSFIGWNLLVYAPAILLITSAVFNGDGTDLITAIVLSIPLTFTYLFLRPYIEAANAAFYRSLVPAKTEEIEAPVAEWYLPE